MCHSTPPHPWVNREPRKVGTEDNVADISTKGLPPQIFYKHRFSLNIKTKTEFLNSFICKGHLAPLHLRRP